MRLLLPLLIAQNLCWVLAGEEDAGAEPTAAPLAENAGSDSLTTSQSAEAGAAEAAPAGLTEQSSTSMQTEALSVPDAALKEANSKLVSKISDLEAQLAAKQTQLEGKTKEILELGEKVKQHETEKTSNAAQLEEKATTISTMKSEVSDLTSKLDQEKKDNTELTQKVSEKDAKIQDLTEQMKKQTRDKEHAETETKNLQEELTKEVTRFRDQIAVQEASISELKENLRIGAEDNRQLKNRAQFMEESFYNLSALYADPSIQHFLTAKAIKVARDPGVAGAINKTYVYVLPSLRHRYGEGESLIANSTNFLQSKLNAFIGSEKVDPWLPFASGLLIYGAVFIPLLCAVCCLTKIVCRRRGCLIFWHLYLSCTCAYASFFAFSTGKDTLAAFAMHDGALFLFLQTATGLVLVWYFLLLLTSCCCFSKSSSSEFFWRTVQVLLVLPVIIPYYLCVWTPAMQDDLPRLDEMTFAVVGHRAVRGFVWVPYATSGVIFFLILMLDVLCGRGAKKGQQQQQEVSIGVRNVEDQFSPLAALVGNGGGDGDVELGQKSA